MRSGWQIQQSLLPSGFGQDTQCERPFDDCSVLGTSSIHSNTLGLGESGSTSSMETSASSTRGDLDGRGEASGGSSSSSRGRGGGIEPEDTRSPFRASAHLLGTTEKENNEGVGTCADNEGCSLYRRPTSFISDARKRCQHHDLARCTHKLRSRLMPRWGLAKMMGVAEKGQVGRIWR